MVYRTWKTWWGHARAELSGPSGWLLLGKFLFYFVGFIAAVLTSWSIIENEVTERNVSILTQADHIQSGLVSNNPWERIAAFHQLKVFALSYAAGRSAFSSKGPVPFKLSKDMLLRQFGQYQNSDSAADAPLDVQPSKDDTGSASQLSQLAGEKTLALKTLADLGAAGWNSDEPLPPSQTVDEYEIHFSWIASQEKSAGDDISVFDVLKDRNFDYVALTGADFSCVTLSQTAFDHAHLTRIRFFQSVLTGASFQKARLEYLNVYGAQARRADFSGATITAITTLKLPEQQSATSIGEYSNASAGCTEGKTDLSAARFLRSQVFNSSFEGADMQEVVFSAAVLSKNRFDYANLVGAQFDDASVSESSFMQTKLFASIFERARLSQVRFDGADLSFSSFVGAVILDDDTKKSLLKARVKGANFLGVIGVGDPLFCSFVRERAVFVSDMQGWEDRSKAMNLWLLFAPADVRSHAQNCYGRPSQIAAP